MQPPLFCRRCATDNPAGAAVCADCGMQLATEDTDTRADSNIRSMAKLTALEEPLASNPFLILHLPAGASGSDIRRTIERARIEVRLGSDPDLESRIDVLTKAQSELLDPSKRVHHEILWFYDPPDCCFDGSLEDTDQALTRFRSVSDTENDWQKTHDLALWLLVEAIHNVDPESAERWTLRALSAWREMAGNPYYIRHITGVDKSFRSPTETIWGLGLSVLAACARRCMNAGDVDGVLSRYRGAKACGLEMADLLKIVEPAVEIEVLEGQRVVADARTASEQVRREPGEALSWAQRLERDLSDQVALQGQTTYLGARELEVVLDEAAYLIRQVAVSLHSDVSETQSASELVDVALRMAVSRKAIETLEVDLVTLRGLVAVGPLTEVIEQTIHYISNVGNVGGLFTSAEALYAALAGHQGQDHESAITTLKTGLEVLRAAAIQLHNHYSHTANAATVMGWCVELAGDADERRKFNVDHRQLLYQMHLARSVGLREQKHWTEAQEAADTAYSYADSEEDRRQATLTALGSRKPDNRVVWILVAVGVAALVIWGIWGSSTSSEDGSSGSSNEGGTTSCSAMRIDLNGRETTLDSLDSQLNSLKAQYPEGAPSSVVDRYDSLYSRYERLRSQYNNIVQDYNKECT